MKNCPYCKQIMDDFDITCRSCGKMVVLLKPQPHPVDSAGSSPEPTALSTIAASSPSPLPSAPLPTSAVPAVPSSSPSIATVAAGNGGFKPTGQQGAGMNMMDYAANQSLSKPVGLGQMHYIKKQSKSPIALVVVAVLIGIGVFFEYQHHAISDVIDAFFGPDWVRYTEDEYGFSASFPEYPVHDGEDIEIPPGYGMSGVMSVHMFYTETDDETFAVGIVDYPESWDIGYDDYVLETFAAGMRGGSESEVVSSKASSYGDYPAVEFETKADEYRMTGIIFGVDNRIYMIMSGFADRYYSGRKADKFMDSFKLIDPGMISAQEQYEQVPVKAEFQDSAQFGRLDIGELNPDRLSNDETSRVKTIQSLLEQISTGLVKFDKSAF